MTNPKNDRPRKAAPQWQKQKRLAATPHKRIDNDSVKRDPLPPPIPVNQRLAFRPAEFAALVGVSYVTIWRAIKSGKIDTIVQNGVKVIPRSYAVKAGYITDNV